MWSDFDTYFERIPRFDPDFTICGICGAPLTEETREQYRALIVGLCEKCYQIHSHKTRHQHPPQKCPFPWMYHCCTLNHGGYCIGAYSLYPTGLLYQGIKWWDTNYERCLRDHEAIMELMDPKRLSINVATFEWPVIGYYVIEDSEKYRWHWMGRSPRVRKAVETYLTRHEPGKWNTTPNESQKAIAKEIGVTPTALSKNYNELLRKGIISADDNGDKTK